MNDERDESADPAAGSEARPLSPTEPAVPETEEELEHWIDERPLEPAPPPDDAGQR